MLIVFPKKVRIVSELSQGQVKSHFDKNIIPFKSHGSLVGMSGFIKKYKTAEVLYGNRNGDKIRVSHHAPKKTDGSSTTFYGCIEKDGKKSVVTGRIMKPVSTCVFGGVFLLVMMLMALVCLAIGQYVGAAVFAVSGILSLLVLFRDGGKSKKLMSFLEQITKE